MLCIDINTGLIMTKYLAVLLFPLFLFASDWPVYKGNIYFTGNNDEIIVKNSNLKWLFQADERVFNPVASDGLLYFVDIKGQLYCLNEETGIQIWKISMKDLSARFGLNHRSAGKIKYPLIKGGVLFITDPVALYAVDRFSGKVLWARTGMRESDLKIAGKAGNKTRPSVDGIYSDPVLSGDDIFYGTRETFIARAIGNGVEKWSNGEIKSFSAYPTFYDDRIFTQSMDYSKNEFSVQCLSSSDGIVLWKRNIQVPLRLFPPVVYKSKVYVMSSSKLFALDLKNGNIIFEKDYKRVITSNPAFTERSILFAVDNKSVCAVNPDDGEVTGEIEYPQQSSPQFVTVRDQIYTAFNSPDENGRSYGNVRAVNFQDGSVLWEYKTPFPGGVSQPCASGGILFLPSGNYIYAVGALYYPRIVKGGSANNSTVNPGQSISGTADFAKNDDGVKLREISINIKKQAGKNIPATAEVRKYDDKGRVLYSRREITDKGRINVPDGDDVEILIESGGYIPKKVIIGNNYSSVSETLEEIEKGKSFTVDNINFETGKAYLKKESLNIIDDLINQMKMNVKMKIEIRGFTDNVGGDEYNQKLSEKRADSVTEYMVKNGISPERVKGSGFGKNNPVADNSTEDGRRKNRRTEFFIVEN